jgi:uncharacterized protein YhjY with autotransporter beta-barrel domain
MDRTRRAERETRLAENAVVAGGSTNASDVTTSLSTSWQQAIAQFIIPAAP